MRKEYIPWWHMSNIGGGESWTPEDLEPEYWFDATDPDTVTLNGSNVSSFLSKGSVSGKSMVQATESKQPAYVANTYILTDGVDDLLLLAAAGMDALSQANTQIFIFSWVAAPSGSNGWLMECGVSDFYYSKGLKRYRITGGTTLSSDDQWEIDTSIHYFINEFNGATSKQYLDGVQISGGNAGAGAMDGIGLGASAAGTSPVNIKFYESLVVNRILTAGEKSSVGSYFDDKYGSFSISQAVGARLQSGASGSDVFIASKILAETSWVQDDVLANITPTYPVGNKYLSMRWADWFENDQLITTPLLAKYGFRTGFHIPSGPVTDSPLEAYLDNPAFDGNRDARLCEKYNCISGAHGFSHFSYLYTFPLYDGFNTPTDNEMRVDRGDGLNEFGHPLDEAVVDSIGSTVVVSYFRLDSTLYNKEWQNLSDADCQTIRDSVSCFKVETDYAYDQEYLESLDYLSNRYLGTTGYSVKDGDYSTRDPNTADGLYPSSSNPILGGVFSGSHTTANHEIWERVMEIEFRWKAEVYEITRHDTYWVVPGGGTPNFTYKTYDPQISFPPRFHDVAKTKIADMFADFYGSISGTTRSLADVFRANGFKSTGAASNVGFAQGAATGMVQLETQRMFKLNLNGKKNDHLGDGYTKTLRIFDNTLTEAQMNTLMSGADVVKECYDLTATDAAWSSLTAYTRRFDDFINKMVTFQTWGMIPLAAGDAGANTVEHDASYAMFYEALMQYCLRAGIQIIPQDDAWEMAYNESYSMDNWFPNPTFERSAFDVLASANCPLYPDGWDGGVVITDTVDGDTENVLHLDNTGGGSTERIFIRNYAVIPGTFDFSIWVLGTGYVVVKLIRAEHDWNDVDGQSFESWLTQNSTWGSWTQISFSDTIPDAALVEYSTPADAEERTTQNYLNGYDNKVIGIHIELIATAGNELKISLPEITIT